MKKCSIKNCKNTYYSKNFCKTHYDKNRRHGDPLFEEKIVQGLPCPIDNCGKPIINNGMCSMHDRRMKRHGDPRFINPKCNRDDNYLKRARIKSAQWKKDNPALNNAFNKTRKRKIKETKLKSVNDQDMIKIYMECPDGFQVDHIIPISHELVSGLHVPWNMQYLSKRENMAKSNKFDGTYENESWRKDF